MQKYRSLYLQRLNNNIPSILGVFWRYMPLNLQIHDQISIYVYITI